MNGNELKKLFGLKVKKYRMRMNLSQEELSEIINRTQRQVSLIELGKSFPSPDTITALSNALGCEITDFFDFSYSKNIEDMRQELLDTVVSMSENQIKTFYIISKNI